MKHELSKHNGVDISHMMSHVHDALLYVPSDLQLAFFPHTRHRSEHFIDSISSNSVLERRDIHCSRHYCTCCKLIPPIFGTLYVYISLLIVAELGGVRRPHRGQRTLSISSRPVAPVPDVCARASSPDEAVLFLKQPCTNPAALVEDVM